MINTNLSFLSIDNFYNDPHAVRDFALSCEYRALQTSAGYPFGQAPWPGKMSKVAYQPKHIDNMLGKLLNKVVVQQKGNDSGKFRISKLGEPCRNMVHADSIYREPARYAGVLYLNLPEQHNDQPGTIFYQHTPSGERVLKNKTELQRIVASGEDRDLKYWKPELVSYVTWNRLIIYPAHYFHGVGPLFGGTDHDARLVQLFFWESIE